MVIRCNVSPLPYELRDFFYPCNNQDATFLRIRGITASSPSSLAFVLSGIYDNNQFLVYVLDMSPYIPLQDV